MKIEFLIDYKVGGNSYETGDRVTVQESDEFLTLVKHGIVKNLETGEQNETEYGSFKIEAQNSGQSVA